MGALINYEVWIFFGGGGVRKSNRDFDYKSERWLSFETHWNCLKKNLGLTANWNNNKLEQPIKTCTWRSAWGSSKTDLTHGRQFFTAAVPPCSTVHLRIQPNLHPRTDVLRFPACSLTALTNPQQRYVSIYRTAFHPILELLNQEHRFTFQRVCFLRRGCLHVIRMCRS
jgi:hypothetical protein